MKVLGQKLRLPGENVWLVSWVCVCVCAVNLITHCVTGQIEIVHTAAMWQIVLQLLVIQPRDTDHRSLILF